MNIISNLECNLGFLNHISIQCPLDYIMVAKREYYEIKVQKKSLEIKFLKIRVNYKPFYFLFQFL